MNFRLPDLIDLSTFEALLRRLTSIYEFTSAIVDNEGAVLVATGWQDVCTKFHRAHPECARQCQLSDQYILKHLHEANPAVSYRCAHGLTDTAVPIIVDGHHVASFFTGQIFLEPPNLVAFRGQAELYGFDEASYLAAVSKVPVWSREKLERHLSFIKSLADLLVGVAEQRLRQDRTELELATLSRRLQHATTAAKAGVWDWDPVSGEMTWDRRMFELYGLEPDTLLQPVDAWKQGVEPADRARTIAECQAALRGEREFDSEFRVRRPDGSVIEVAAKGYVVRGPDGAATRMTGVNVDISARKAFERELREGRENLSLALRSSGMGAWRLDLQTGRRDFDELVCRCLGIDPDHFAGTPDEFYDAVHPDDREGLKRSLRQTIETGGPYEIEFRVVWPDESVHYVASRARLSVDEQGAPASVSGLLWDETSKKLADEERIRLEGQLRQAQKMESVGRLAGGVAHDFNNMLSVVLGHADLVLARMSPGDPLVEDLTDIRAAAKRAAAITRQLLAFARRQPIAPKVVDVNDLVTGMLKMLGRLIGEDITLHWHPSADLWSVKVDPSQIDQVLANLCVNARDAIDGVGHITVETRNVVLDEAHCAAHPGSLAGEFVRLAVSDTGRGIDKDTLPLVFDPFFTTKPLGHGTGLGLATVYGIAKQNNGFVNVQSELGQGSTFAFYLPRARESVESAAQAVSAGAVKGRSETILLVEDEPAILKMATRMLTDLNYDVIPAATPAEAVGVAGARPRGSIQLLLTDVVMPEMDGRELAHRVKAFHPHIACVYTSGYTANIIADRGVLDEGVVFLGKPFSRDHLAAKIREALETARLDNPS